MDLSLRTESFSQDRRDWLGSEHGTDCPRGITLDVSTFAQADHYPDGYLKSGLPVAEITASGLYGLYAGDAIDGRETLAGFLFTGVEVVDHRGRVSAKVGGSMLVHGFVRADKLPVPVDADGMADVASRIYTV
ncbi:head decoration protein [Streptomyces sp. NPDC056061]|uniref:head decoration protein n=1 Tax=Streptomyces sp. NPDC056061 TaxID=3345700 RepID=UPI0035DABF68